MTRRVLNLIDQPGPTGLTPLLRLTADLARVDASAGDAEHAWLLVGGEGLQRSARAAGIETARARLLPRPAGVRAWLPGAMGIYRAELERADRVACWTLGATRLASQVGCAHAVPRFSQATPGPVASAVIAPAAQRIAQDPEPLRQAARLRWGVPDAAFVIGVLADRPEQVDVREMLLALAFTHETLEACDSPHRDARMVCHPDCAGRRGAGELAGLLAWPRMLVQDAAMLKPWDTLVGCDLLVAPCPGQAGLSLQWADALGLPVVAPPAPHLVGLDTLVGLCVAESGSAKHLAKAVTDYALSRAGTGLTLVS